MSMENKFLAVFDIETTGLNKETDQIIQFGGVKVNKETYEVVDTYNTYIQPRQPYVMSIQGYFKHGISPQMLADKPTFKECAPQIIEWMRGCDILTYNGMSFDIPFFMNECKKNEIECDLFKVDGSVKYYDAYCEEQKRHSNTLEGTFERYVGKTMQDAGLDAHNALSDVLATIEVFKQQNKTSPVSEEKMYGYDNIIKDMNFKGNMMPCMNFGKYKQIPLQIIKKIDKNYIMWGLGTTSGFSNDTKDYLKGLLKQ